MIIKDKRTNNHFLKVIEVLMEEDPKPTSRRGIALSYLVDQVKEFEDKTYPSYSK